MRGRWKRGRIGNSIVQNWKIKAKGVAGRTFGDFGEAKARMRDKNTRTESR